MFTSNLKTLGFYEHMGYKAQGMTNVVLKGFHYPEMRLTKVLAGRHSPG